jgi:bifunctional non-homologous end joining protein LigD
MSLDEYKRKRRFEETPEPPPKVEKKSRHRFVVQRHAATRLHYDFRLEMQGVLKSWAVPKGPSLDPADKRLAMQVEDHPVSYFDFEGTIPQGNYGGGTVMVWDEGTWEPLSPVPVNGEYVPGTEKEAVAMLEKGDLKFRLKGKRLKGDFALVHIKARRPGSKGNEWLLIKKKDSEVVPKFDIDAYATSILTDRTMKQIAGDEDSAEWKSSRPAARGGVKAGWLADAVARADARRKAAAGKGSESAGKIKSAESKKAAPVKKKSQVVDNTGDVDSASDSPPGNKKTTARAKAADKSVRSTRAAGSLEELTGAQQRAMPAVIQPMLASIIEKSFDNPDWLFEIKWDGYRAITFIDGGRTRLVSRNQNDLTSQFAELATLAKYVKAERAILDGEIVALDDAGRPSFSLMQQRTGFRPGKRRLPGRSAQGVAIIYYAFDLLYLDGFDLRRVALEQRKQLLQDRIKAGDLIHYSDHYPEKGLDLFEAAKQRGLEGIVAKKRNSCYEERRSREWLKIKITQRQECVIGGYTDPEGSREYFGALVLGLYDRQGRLIHVGQVGTGFDHKALKEMYARLEPLKMKENPFYGSLGGLRKVQFFRPELVAEIKFSEWTHETAEGGVKLRAPVFMGLRSDKSPAECRLDEAIAS